VGDLVDSGDEGNLLSREARNKPTGDENLLIEKIDLYRKS
jgi:hypothetical protein